MPRTLTLAAVLLGGALLTGCGEQRSAVADPVPAPADQVGPSVTSGTAPDELVKTMVLPHDEPGFPAGPGAESFLTACATCHSTRYVSMQPAFSRAVWNAEVHKMAKVYGAPIAEERMPELVDYLVSYQAHRHPESH